MITENLSTLKIHKLTQAQYDRELAVGNIDETALYLTPDEEVDLSGYATVEQLNTKADASDVTALKTLVGDETVSSQISTAMANNVAGSAVKLEIARQINGVSFDGSADITVPANFGVTTSGTGSAYKATVNGISRLTVGVSFIMIPHVSSSSTSPTLNVNGLGAKSIRRRVSTSTNLTTEGYTTNWLVGDRPIRVEYDGGYWIADLPKPSAADISGTLEIANGGTNASTVSGARENLGLTGITTGGNGAAYTATVPGIDSLATGASFIMIPHTTAISTIPTLNVNNLGAKRIGRNLSNKTGSVGGGITPNLLISNKPIRVEYDGDFWIVSSPQPNAEDLVGAVPIANGGTGATTASDARTNLEVCQSIPDSTYPNCHYRMNGTTKEWINPPMIAGTEYRTTERYENKPVYVKLVNAGAMANTGTTNVTVGTNLTIVSIDGKATSGKYVIPIHVINSINSIYYHTTNGTITIETNKDASSWTATLIVKYTK